MLVKSLILVVALQAILIALDLAFPPDMGRAERSSPVVLDRRGAWLKAAPVEDGRWRLRADLDRIDPIFVRRLIALEDERFSAACGRRSPGPGPRAGCELAGG